MVFKGYSKRDTAVLKGFGILCIVFHNYFHWLWPSPGENEFTFDPGRVSKFFAQLGEQPGEFFNLIFQAKLKKTIFTLDTKTGIVDTIYSENAWLNHLQFSPTDPTLLMFCHEGPWHEVPYMDYRCSEAR